MAGIIASLFGIASFISAGSSPDTSSSVEDITNYLIQGRTSIVHLSASPDASILQPGALR